MQNRAIKEFYSSVSSKTNNQHSTSSRKIANPTHSNSLHNKKTSQHPATLHSLLQPVPQRLAEVIWQRVVQVLPLEVMLPAVPEQRVQPAETRHTRAHYKDQYYPLHSSPRKLQLISGREAHACKHLRNSFLHKFATSSSSLYARAFTHQKKILLRTLAESRGLGRSCFLLTSILSTRHGTYTLRVLCPRRLHVCSNKYTARARVSAATDARDCARDPWLRAPPYTLPLSTTIVCSVMTPRTTSAVVVQYCMYIYT